VSIAQIPCKVIKQKTIVNLGFGQADFLDLARSEMATTATHVDVSGAVKTPRLSAHLLLSARAV
jgi:hypothetical protein